MILLITKYNLSSRWLHLFTFFILYLICIKLHYIDLNNDFVECMMQNSINLPDNHHNNDYRDNSRYNSEDPDANFVVLDDLAPTNIELGAAIERFDNTNIIQKARYIEWRLNMLEADVKFLKSNKIEIPEAIDTSNFITVDQLTKSHQELYANIENSFKKELSTVSTLQTELTNEINTRKALETRVTNLEEELREIRRALMFRGTIMDPLVQHQLTLNEVKQTTQENSIASIPR